MKIDYYIGGVSLRSLGVYVTKSAGYRGKPKPQDEKTERWAGEHGEALMPSSLRFRSRDISLDCFHICDHETEAWQTINTILERLQSTEPTATAELRVHEGERIVFLGQVRLSDGIDLQMASFGTAEEEVYRFTLKLKQYEPNARTWHVPKATPLRLRGKTEGVVSVYWGDGTSSLDLSGAVDLSRGAHSEDRYIHITGTDEALKALTLEGGQELLGLF